MTTQKYHSNKFEPNTTQDRMTTEQTRTLLAMEAYPLVNVYIAMENNNF